jgi:hypothetical protein
MKPRYARFAAATGCIFPAISRYFVMLIKKSSGEGQLLCDPALNA